MAGVVSSNNFSSEVIGTHKKYSARVLKVETPHGVLNTPCFMPVGTRAAVNCMDANQLKTAGSQIILGGNTYHMLVSPEVEVIRSLGGMHRMMNWHHPMLTDSGGFQVFSLSQNKKICQINEQGAVFKHPDSGKKIYMTPEISIQTQKAIGADIIMAFDQCTPEAGGEIEAIKAMERTSRWLKESIEAHEKNKHSDYGFRQALFGIIQGGSYKKLRELCAEELASLPLDGLAIGGEIIGFDMKKTVEIISWVRPYLPANKIRYTMGVGLQPQDLIDVVREGIDIFDCVAPTRNARHGALYHGKIVKTEMGKETAWVRFENRSDNGRLLIKKAIYRQDDSPIDEDCDCETCQFYSRGYLHYLFKQNQALYFVLACIHNVRMMHRTCEVLREVILASQVKQHSFCNFS